jgi:hypothetical protein
MQVAADILADDGPTRTTEGELERLQKRRARNRPPRQRLMRRHCLAHAAEWDKLRGALAEEHRDRHTGDPE